MNIGKNSSFNIFHHEEKSIAPQKGDIRLLQHVPAWDLQLLLRSKSLLFRSENVEFDSAQGQKLPVLINGNMFLTENSALLTFCSTNRWTFDDGRNCLSADELVLAAYVENLRQYIRYLTRNDLASVKNRHMVKSFWSLIKIWILGDETIKNSSFYSGCTEDWGVFYLPTAYAYLESRLGTSSTGLLSDSSKPGLADALLFSHIMESSNNNKITEISSKFHKINDFVATMLKTYFTGDQARRDWAMPNYVLAQNRVVASDQKLASSLTEGIDLELLLSSPPVEPEKFISKESKFVFDFSLSQLIPWKPSEHSLQIVNGPVLIGLRGVIFSALVAVSFIGFAVKRKF